MNRILRFRHLLTRDGILHDRQLELDRDGRVSAINPASDGPYDGWLAMPGIPNAHSHVFQRALAGYGEARGEGEDSFWSWREAMYRLAASVTPEDLLVIARQGFIEMLRTGFTSVAEFHYLHHLPDGSRTTAMADAVVQAATDVGIRMRLLPVAYFHGGFNQPPQPGQRRFVHDDSEEFLELLARLQLHQPGIAPHSLRAVAPDELQSLVDGATRVLGNDYPIHIHIAEQQKEVADCQGAFGRRPVELLNEKIELDSRWNLVHATHVTEIEWRGLLEREANVVLCPITEAYLGDGIFPAVNYMAAGGQLAIGSDSNCRIDAFEEMRWLEYGQRLRDQRRARLADGTGLSPVLNGALSAGATALQMPIGDIQVGHYADLVVFEESSPALLGHGIDSAVDALLVNGSPADPSAIYVGGERRVEGGEHGLASQVATEFNAVVRRLLG